LVGMAISIEKDLSELSLEQLRGGSELIEEDIYEVLTLEGSVAARNHIGGTNPDQVLAAIARARIRIEERQH